VEGRRTDTQRVRVRADHTAASEAIDISRRWTVAELRGGERPSPKGTTDEELALLAAAVDEANRTRLDGALLLR
jgi:hypothetical protein